MISQTSNLRDKEVSYTFDYKSRTPKWILVKKKDIK